MKTLSSSTKKFPSLHNRLFLTGEVLHIDGITGGYNFQSAWSTGYAAGQACAKSLISQDIDQIISM
jgi:predicted flavoprotein YhiN